MEYQLSQSYLQCSKQPDGEQFLFNIIVEKVIEYLDEVDRHVENKIDWNNDEMLDDELQNELFNSESRLTYDFPHNMVCKSYILTKTLKIYQEGGYDAEKLVKFAVECYDDDLLVNCYAITVWNEGLKDALKEHYKWN